MQSNSPPRRFLVRPSLVALTALAGATFGPVRAQGADGSQAALDLTAPTARVVFALDDEAPGDLSTPADVGAGDFTLELWLRGFAADNPTANAGGDVELAGAAWLDGNVVLDRSADKTGREWGVSIAGGFVRFGTGGGDGAGAEAAHTLEGDTPVLDGAWHHVACVRDSATGVKSIFVDGALDVASAPGVSTVDLSYPDEGVPGGAPASNPELHLGGPKDASFAPFHGLVDEVRVWTRAATLDFLLSWSDRVLNPSQPGLVADWRAEEPGGSTLVDHGFKDSPAGAMIGGAAWRTSFAKPQDTAPISHGVLPPGFHRELVLTGFVEPTSMLRLPDGDFLIAERGGRVLRLDPSTAQPGSPPATTEVLQITPNLLTIEYGIVGMTLDPAFTTNGFVYLHYTSFTPSDRVSRFTMPNPGSGGGAIDPASEVVIWENLAVGPGHTGGSISFGPDGKLYIPTGDAFDPPSSQDLSHPNGKVIRVNPDGTYPPDNPAASIPGAYPGIWAWGLRNPFRSWWDPLTGVFWIADVGGEPAVAWEELHHGAAGANYGWPVLQGTDCYIGDCSGMSVPFYGYRHDDPDLSPGQVAAAVIGGQVYRGASFPSDYVGDFFVADYATGWIRRLRLDAGGALEGSQAFIPAFSAGTIVDLLTDDAGDLWYLTVGLPWAGGVDEASLFRVRYVADDAEPISTVVLDSSPSGLTLFLDGYPVTTPFALRTHAGASHQVSAPVVGFHEPTMQTVTWTCWSDGSPAAHELIAPLGGQNLTAVFTTGGAGCDSGSGFSTYGHAAGGANTLGLVGGSGAAPGATLVTKTTGLSEAPGTGCWVGVAPSDWSFPILGGTVLIDSLTQFATKFLVPVGGEAVWNAPLPAQPGLAGAELYLQALATDPAAPFGLAFSNGLKVVLGP